MPRGTAAFAEDKSDGGRTRRITHESFADGGAQFRRSIIIQEAQELGGLRCRGLASLESGIEKLFTFRNGAGETPSGCRSPGLALTFQQGYLVGGIRDKLVAIIGAAMARNFSLAIENPHRVSEASSVKGRPT